jgi:DNA-binding response OmpR family regulator
LRILLLEDQKKTVEFIEKGLSAAGYVVDAFVNPSIAEEALCGTDYDLLIVDINLPEKSGWDFIRQARQDKYEGIIVILTAFATTDDKVKGLDVGADDYMTKPFSIDELLARIRAHFRRQSKTGIGNRLIFEDVEIDLVSRRVTRGSIPLSLSQKEFALLEYFMRNPDRPLSRAQISEHVWNVDFETGTNVIDVYINHLRKKMENQHFPRLIHTVTGIGYELRKP